jgi:hypothetical protein
MDEDRGSHDRAQLLKLWHEYGKTYNAFVPEEQPDPRDWDRPLPVLDDKGTLDPQALKHWRYFEKTRNFLRQRYADYGTLPGPALTFDCLVPQFQKPLDVPAAAAVLTHIVYDHCFRSELINCLDNAPYYG